MNWNEFILLFELKLTKLIKEGTNYPEFTVLFIYEYIDGRTPYLLNLTHAMTNKKFLLVKVEI